MTHKIRFVANENALYVDDQLVPIEESRQLRQHSHDFSFGYLGSGPAQSALAILLRVTNKETAERYYQRFKEEFCAVVPGDEDWEREWDIGGWLAGQVGVNVN